MPILINLLRAYWKPLICFLILAYCFYEYNSLKSDNARLNAVVLKYQITSEQQLEHNKNVIKQQEKITADVVQSYSDSINKLKDYYAKNPNIKFKSVRVYDGATSGGEVSSIPNTTKPIDDTADGTIETSTTGTTTEIQINAELASKEIVQLLELQRWVKEQVEVK